MDEVASQPGRAQLVAHIPERFCSVHIVTCGGNISLVGLTEAALDVDTGGGDVRAGKVKATRAGIVTHGGAVSGAVTAGGAHLRSAFDKRNSIESTCIANFIAAHHCTPFSLPTAGAWRAEVRINTTTAESGASSSPDADAHSTQHPQSEPSLPASQASGCVTLQRLAGNDVTVQTTNAAVDLGVCYCDALHVATHGGDISASHLNCQGASGRVLLASDGGSVRIGGLDGVAEICSGDGDMALQVRASAATESSAAGSYTATRREAL